MVPKENLVILKSKRGKYVVVKNVNGSMMLLAEDLQKPNVRKAHKVIMKEHPGTQCEMQMAFSCQHGSEYYSPIVTDKQELKLVKMPDSEMFDEKSWFKRENHGNGSYYCLKSVAQPQKYLSISGTKLSISDVGILYIKHEKISPS